MSDNESYTHQYHETKSVKKWINSSRLRREWWRRCCPICGATSLRFKLAGAGDTEVKKVSCFECDWEVE